MGSEMCIRDSGCTARCGNRQHLRQRGSLRGGDSAHPSIRAGDAEGNGTTGNCRTLGAPPGDRLGRFFSLGLPRRGGTARRVPEGVPCLRPVGRTLSLLWGGDPLTRHQRAQQLLLPAVPTLSPRRERARKSDSRVGVLGRRSLENRCESSHHDLVSPGGQLASGRQEEDFGDEGS